MKTSAQRDRKRAGKAARRKARGGHKHEQGAKHKQTNAIKRETERLRNDAELKNEPRGFLGRFM